MDKIAHPAPYEGFPACPTIYIPSGTYTYYEFYEKSLKKKKLLNWPKKTSIGNLFKNPPQIVIIQEKKIVQYGIINQKKETEECNYTRYKFYLRIISGK